MSAASDQARYRRLIKKMEAAHLRVSLSGKAQTDALMAINHAEQVVDHARGQAAIAKLEAARARTAYNRLQVVVMKLAANIAARTEEAE